VPAPPAVIDIVPAVFIEPAKVPATPPDVVVVFPSIGNDPTIPLLTVVAEGVASPSMNDSEYEKALPGVVTE
tara:strand:+ start:58 stop:273 length:216 start_codon:yes stop_codon:yes gene_type:complete